MRHEDEEVEQAAEDDGDELFEEAREHGKKLSVVGSQLSVKADRIRLHPDSDSASVSEVIRCLHGL
jgi:hypothetical protein